MSGKDAKPLGKKETKVVEKTLNPWWHADFSFENVVHESTQLTFEVVDKNKGMMTSDVSLGQVTVTLSELQSKGLSRDGKLLALSPLSLQAGGKKQKVSVSGTLDVMVGWMPPSPSPSTAARG